MTESGCNLNKPVKAVSRRSGFANTPQDHDWLDKNIPCQKACPAGTDIPGYLAAIYDGKYDDAYEMNLRDNVFPGVLGRVCARPCERECRHGWEGNGEPVAICFSKRSAADYGKKQRPVLLAPLFPPSGKTVAVVGSGVAGLAAARELARYGHSVTVFEKHTRPGGMLNQAIPVFRLPRDVIDLEIEQIRRLGVEIRCGVAIGSDITLSELKATHDAVVMAAGTLRPNIPEVPGVHLKHVQHGLDFLLEVNEFGRTFIGKRVIIIGGGYTAMDCSRTAIRLGAQSVQVLYRRSEKELLILPDELKQLREESGFMDFCCTPIEFTGHNGHLQGIKAVRTKPSNNRNIRAPWSGEALLGSEFDVEADEVILATGQFPKTDWIDGSLKSKLVAPDQWLKSGANCSTEERNVFVAGDFATGARTLIDAIGHAKNCAVAVDTFLQGDRRVHDVASVEDTSGTTGRAAGMELIPRHDPMITPVPERTFTEEVELGFTRSDSQHEASRCYFCNYKFEIDNAKCVLCDGCLMVKPKSNCIVETSSVYFDENSGTVKFELIVPGMTNSLYDGRLWIDQSQCIRCGACMDACPTGAISLQKVSKCMVTTTQLNAQGEETSETIGAFHSPAAGHHATT